MRRGGLALAGLGRERRDVMVVLRHGDRLDVEAIGGMLRVLANRGDHHVLTEQTDDALRSRAELRLTSS